MTTAVWSVFGPGVVDCRVRRIAEGRTFARSGVGGLRHRRSSLSPSRLLRAANQNVGRAEHVLSLIEVPSAAVRRSVGRRANLL